MARQPSEKTVNRSLRAEITTLRAQASEVPRLRYQLGEALVRATRAEDENKAWQRRFDALLEQMKVSQ